MNQIRQQYCFGNFMVDPAERLLTRDGDAIRLPPKVFDTLMVLVENRGRLVAKDELITRIWPDTFIEEATLARNISDLRKALGQAADQKYIETIPKHGYRFVADVRELSPVSDDLVLEVYRTAHTVTEEIKPPRSGDEVESGDTEQTLGATMISSVPARKARYGIYWLALGGAAAIIAASVLYLWRSESRVAGSAE